MENQEKSGQMSGELSKLLRQVDEERSERTTPLTRRGGLRKQLPAAAATNRASAGADGEGGGVDFFREEADKLRTKVFELESTLASVMASGMSSGEGRGRAAGAKEKLMQHIKSLQEEVKKGERSWRCEILSSHQAQLREEAEEAKFYQEEAEARSRIWRIWRHSGVSQPRGLIRRRT